MKKQSTNIVLGVVAIVLGIFEVFFRTMHLDIMHYLLIGVSILAGIYFIVKKPFK